MKYDLGKIIWLGVGFTVLSAAVNSLASILAMGFYANPAYFALWSTIMMSGQGPPTISFYVMSLIFGFVVGIIFAWVYSLVSKSVPGKGVRKGLNYGLLLFGLAGVPYALTTYLLLAVPVGLLLVWSASSLVVYLVAGIVFEKILKEPVARRRKR